MKKAMLVIVLGMMSCFARSDVACLPTALKSPGFEADGIWQSDCDGDSRAFRREASRVSGGVPEGRYCGYLCKRGGKSTYAALGQKVQVKEGETYLLSGKAKGMGRLFVRFYDAKNGFLGQDVGLRVNSLNWMHLRMPVSIMSRAIQVQVRFELYGENVTGEGWVDDVYWGPLPTDPGRVTGLTARRQGTSEVVLNWQPSKSSGLRRYDIFRSRYADMRVDRMHPCGSTDSSRWVDRSVPTDWDHCYYQVCAVGEHQMLGTPSDRPLVTFGERIPNSQPVVWTSSPLIKYRRHQEVPVRETSLNQRASIQLAKNEAESLQISVGTRQNPIRQLSVRLEGFDGKLKGSLHRVHYTNVKHPSIDPLNNRPGLFADALSPWQGPIRVPEFSIQSIWLQVVSAVDCPAGNTRGTVIVSADGKVLARIAVEAEVWDFTVPVTPTFQTAFGIWPLCITQAFGAKAGSPEQKKLYDAYYWFMIEHRITPTDIPVSLLSPEADRYLNDPRVDGVRIPLRAKTKIDSTALKQMADHLRKKGWLDKAYVYCIDEPTPARYPFCRDVAKQVHEVGKDIRFLLTEQPEKELIGSVDIWTPLLHMIDWDVYEKRRQAGDSLWWYTCIVPQEPYPTYLIDDTGLSHRMLSWLQAKHRIEGVLYWSVNICTKFRNRRYEDKVTVWEEAEMMPFANGDGYLTYPGTPLGIDGPVSSVRLEILRDGNEDVEYVNLLRKLLTKNGCQDVEAEISALITPVARSLKDWTPDPRTLEQQRQKLARRILVETGQ